MPRGAKQNVVSPEVQKKTKSTGELADSGNWVGFVNVNLSQDEKEYFHRWVAECADDVLPTLDEVLVSGLKFSLSYDAKNDCHIATLTGKALSKFPLFQAAMSARGGDMEQAIALLVYKHVVLCEGDWSKYWTEKRGFGSEV